MRVIGFHEEYIKLEVPRSGDIRTTLSTITYTSEITYKLLIVPLGLKTDLGSIPQILQNIFPKDGLAMFAYILHDWLYKQGKYTQSVCDDILEEAMQSLGVGYLTRKSVRMGLRIGGSKAYQEHRRNDEISNNNNTAT